MTYDLVKVLFEAYNRNVGYRIFYLEGKYSLLRSSLPMNTIVDTQWVAYHSVGATSVVTPLFSGSQPRLEPLWSG